MENEDEKSYSLKEVCLELYPYIKNLSNYKETKDRLRKYFEDFLYRLGIPKICFLDDNDCWRFDNAGKELFIEFCEHRSEKYTKDDPKTIYRDIRKRIYIDKFEKKYDWIIKHICSNLEYNKTRSSFSDRYPTSEEIYEQFMISIFKPYSAEEDVFKLSGVLYLLESIKEQKNYSLLENISKEISDLIIREDVYYINTFIEEDFINLHKLYSKHQKLLIDKWVKYISEAKKCRTELKKTNKADFTQDEQDSLNEVYKLAEESPLSKLDPEKLQYLLSEKKVLEIIEYINERGEKFKELQQRLEAKNIEKWQSSEELYARIAPNLNIKREKK